MDEIVSESKLDTAFMNLEHKSRRDLHYESFVPILLHVHLTPCSGTYAFA
jgi:hypothetical protein